jgi:putative addiction module component (TIGR02574 family)
MRVGNMSTIDALLADAAQLPVADRLELIDALWDTFPDDALPPLSDEWMAEIRRRSAELSAGTATTIPWEVVRGEALVRLSKAPQSNRDE